MARFSLTKLTTEQKKLRKRILEISHESRLSHLGSCLTAIDLIDAIYKIKKKDDLFILSNGHAGIAWYVVLEKYGYIPDPKIIKKFNIHPDRNTKYGIHVSSGSLGQGLPIALGMAFADRKRIVYCMLSDGECAEGSIWEALRVASENNLHNLRVIVNANGWSAYDKVHVNNLSRRMKAFGHEVIKVNGHDQKSLIQHLKQKPKKKPLLFFVKTDVEQFTFLKGQDAHYYVMQNSDYEKAMEALG
jgi:transketolase